MNSVWCSEGHVLPLASITVDINFERVYCNEDW